MTASLPIGRACRLKPCRPCLGLITFTISRFTKSSLDCQIKWKYCTGEAEQKHHISYYPEITVASCTECHKDIHTKQYPELAHYIQYTPGDAKVFYSQNDRIANFLRRTFFRRGKFR